MTILLSDRSQIESSIPPQFHMTSTNRSIKITQAKAQLQQLKEQLDQLWEQCTAALFANTDPDLMATKLQELSSHRKTIMKSLNND